MLVFWIIKIYKETVDFELFHGKMLTFGLAIKLMYHTRTFLAPLIIILFVVGFFIKRPIGWIFTNSIFACVFALIYFIFLPTNNDFSYFYLLGIIPVGLIAINNTTKALDFYKIERTNLFIYNLVVIVLGMGFAFLLGYFSIHKGDNVFEIIYGK